MAKRAPSLAKSMQAVKAAATPAPVAVLVQPPAAPAPTAPKTPKPYFAATREGMKRVAVPLSPEEHRRLKRLAVDTDRSIEALMREALADFFAKSGA